MPLLSPPQRPRPVTLLRPLHTSTYIGEPPDRTVDTGMENWRSAPTAQRQAASKKRLPPSSPLLPARRSKQQSSQTNSFLLMLGFGRVAFTRTATPPQKNGQGVPTGPIAPGYVGPPCSAAFTPRHHA
ncbi:uncharacterized protein PG986_010332 [Apiospora aurea]|uniref:Uncharacterized protein n=1 Tax=Apiospora aurea TaxID=335848 RepID=A0ABR1Q200_9PEZI